MSITKRVDSQEGKGMFNQPRRLLIAIIISELTQGGKEKPPATARRRLSGETVGIDLWL
jgi:hypothetical protein